MYYVLSWPHFVCLVTLILFWFRNNQFPYWPRITIMLATRFPNRESKGTIPIPTTYSFSIPFQSLLLTLRLRYFSVWWEIYSFIYLYWESLTLSFSWKILIEFVTSWWLFVLNTLYLRWLMIIYVWKYHETVNL